MLGGIALTAATLTWTTGSWMQERRVARARTAAVRARRLLVIAGGIGLMIVGRAARRPRRDRGARVGVAGLGMGLSYAPLSLVVLAEAPTGGEGTASAALQLCDTLGVALGTGVSGAIVAAGATLDWTRRNALTIAFALCAVVAVVTASPRCAFPPWSTTRAT